jgi:hypothetical protein
MQSRQTLWQRITAATPPFFKKLQVLGIGLTGMGTSLARVTGVPVKISTSLISIGATITIISQFAVKQYEPINTDANDDTK